MDEKNRDLLVVVLAMVTGAIPRRELFEALVAWAGDRPQELAAALVRYSSIDPHRLEALYRLAEDHLEHHRGDLRIALASWNAMGLAGEGLTEVDDPALRTTMGLALDSQATLPAEPGPPELAETIAGEGGCDETVAVGQVGAGSVDATTAAGGERFRPICMHARGGIGQVWVARDGELQREVALKVIQDRYAENADQRARFLLEAEITGNLEHPGIVPVYSLGQNEQGRPYYAMRLIRGQSLAAAIRQFHLRWRGKGAEADAAGMWGIEFRQLLGRFLDVCDAIDYAHSRGVLHRDLKPANIMLGRYGETLVVDWGLAKVIGKPDIVPAVPAVDAEPSLSTSATRTTSGETQPGTTIGTPSYMSPEQARGALDEMGPPSDVYSLGATLYEVLTGQVAFHGEKTNEVLHRVLKGDFRPPRAVLRSVPAPMEAICLKAMSLERRDRYDTVRELASDIQHWLADEPVAAYSEGRLERMGRWLRRHRTWTTAAAAALIAVTVAATIGVVVVERGRRREMEARELAETNYHLARRAVEEYFTDVSEDTLLKEQNSVDLRRLRKRLLQTALGYYRDFLRQRSGDPELRREVAEAQFRVGEVIREMADEPDEAIAAFQSAIKLWEELRAERPADREPRAELARVWLALGGQYAWTRRFTPAFAAFGVSRELLTQLRGERPGDVSYRLALAECDRGLGVAEGEAGELDKGLAHLREAEGLLRGLLRESPADAAYRKRLAETINSLGFIYAEQRQPARALDAFREYQEICRSLLAEIGSGPKPADLLNSLAMSYYNVGTILFELDRSKVLENFESALRYWSELVGAHPSVSHFRETLGIILTEIGPIRHEVGRDEDAFDAARKAIDIFERLVASQPDQPRYRGELGRALNMLGILHDEFRDNTRALPVFERALQEQERAAAESPETEQYKIHTIDVLQNLGEQHADLSRVERGLPYYRQAVEVRRQILAAHPGDRGRTLELANQFALLGQIERHGGFPAEAEQSYKQASEALEPLVSAQADQDVQVQRGAILLGRGRAVADQGDVTRALPMLLRAVKIVAPFGASPGEDPKPAQVLTEALWEAARVLRLTSHSEEADLREAELRALWKDRPPGELAALALEEAKQAATIGYGKVALDARAEAVRQLDLELAAANLRLAASMGLRDPGLIQKGRDASLLFERPDIRPLLEDVTFPEHPFTPATR